MSKKCNKMDLYLDEDGRFGYGHKEGVIGWYKDVSFTLSELNCTGERYDTSDWNFYEPKEHIVPEEFLL